MQLRFVLVLLGLLLAACSAPDVDLAPAQVGATPTLALQPDYCRGDGAVQSWLLLPLDPPESDLMTAYRAGQVIEFNATVIGAIDEFARLPHRAFVLGEVAEGITMTLDYQGDPPPLLVGQTYRMVAWAYPRVAAPQEPGQTITITNAPGLDAVLPLALPGRGLLENYQSYELQVFDDLGLLFLGGTDVGLQDDPLGIQLASSVEKNCPPVPAPQNVCVQSRQVQPLIIRLGDAELTLYPGDDGQLTYRDMLYEVSVFRNRQVQEADPPCTNYYEHRRSLRIERLQPPPLPPALPPITATLTTTLPITSTLPITPLLP
jgi:hypothetical protein